MKDIAQLLHEFPEAAASILACVTNKPIEQSPGWHPLPSRVRSEEGLKMMSKGKSKV